MVYVNVAALLAGRMQGVPLLQCYGTNRAVHVGTVVVALQVRSWLMSTDSQHHYGDNRQPASQPAIQPKCCTAANVVTQQYACLPKLSWNRLLLCWSQPAAPCTFQQTLKRTVGRALSTFCRTLAPTTCVTAAEWACQAARGVHHRQERHLPLC